jgi:hypothetical protein
MNVGIGTGAAQFLSWEYLFRILGNVSLQCNVEGPGNGKKDLKRERSGGEGCLR